MLPEKKGVRKVNMKKDNGHLLKRASNALLGGHMQNTMANP